MSDFQRIGAHQVKPPARLPPLVRAASTAAVLADRNDRATANGWRHDFVSGRVAQVPELAFQVALWTKSAAYASSNAVRKMTLRRALSCLHACRLTSSHWVSSCCVPRS